MELEDSTHTDRFERLNTMLLDAMPSSVLLLDPGLRVVSANRNFLEKCQRLLSDTVGQRLERVLPEVIIEHIDMVGSITEVFTSGQPIRGKRMTYRAPGVPIRTYYYSILPFMWQGSIEGVLVLMDDITEQIRLSAEVRRVERQLASVVESANDIVFSTDIEGRIMTSNSSAEKLTGYSVHEIEKCNLLVFFSDEDKGDIEKIIRNIDVPGMSREKECSIKTRGDEYLRVHWVFSPMKDERNQTVGVVTVGRDLTERSNFENKLIQSQKLAALGIMASGIAHEIRNPLAICSSSAQFLMDNNISPQMRKECAESVIRGIERASTIIDKLLRCAHSSGNETNLVNIVSLLNESISFVIHHAKIQKVNVKLELPDEPLIVEGVSTLLQQVFINLFLNAISAMPDGGILSVDGKKAGDDVVISVSDTGCGIPTSHIDKILDPFFTTSPVGKGTGLGLSICYAIIKKHNGSIDVRSHQEIQEVRNHQEIQTVFEIKLPGR
jgi:PAS domain S-box-containing protein